MNLIYLAVLGIAVCGLIMWIIHITEANKPTSCTGNCEQGRRCTCGDPSNPK